MRTESNKFELPGKIDRYLAVLSRLYQKMGEAKLREIVVNGAVSIHEEWDYDNWNGGTYGHALTFTIAEDLYLELMEDQDKWENRICTDINKLNNTQNEHISKVFLDMELAEGDQWRENSGILRPRIAASSVPKDALIRIWGDGHVRIFLSHKATIKIETSNLKQSIARYGISCFVAHEDIEPTEEWHREIERSLFSMDAIVALLTADYHDSNWTDQEIGVAIGRGIPVISIRLGRDPYGLMGKEQGLGGCNLTDTEDMAAKIFDVLHKRLPDQSRLFEAVVSAYASSTSWADSAWKVKHLLARYESLTASQVEQVVNAYRNNRENKNSFDGMDNLKPLLEKWTGENWKVSNNELMPATDNPPDISIPFL